jgi:hypothetical protein
VSLFARLDERYFRIAQPVAIVTFLSSGWPKKKGESVAAHLKQISEKPANCGRRGASSPEGAGKFVCLKISTPSVLVANFGTKNWSFVSFYPDVTAAPDVRCDD